MRIGPIIVAWSLLSAQLGFSNELAWDTGAITTSLGSQRVEITF
jgi:hypothetical protein